MCVCVYYFWNIFKGHFEIFFKYWLRVLVCPNFYLNKYLKNLQKIQKILLLLLSLGKNALYSLYFSECALYILHFKNILHDSMPFIKRVLWPFCQVLRPYSPLVTHKLRTRSSWIRKKWTLLKSELELSESILLHPFILG